MQHAYFVELHDCSPIGCPGAGAAAGFGILIGHTARLVTGDFLQCFVWRHCAADVRRLSFRRLCVRPPEDFFRADLCVPTALLRGVGVGPRAVSRGRFFWPDCPVRGSWGLSALFDVFGWGGFVGKDKIAIQPPSCPHRSSRIRVIDEINYRVHDVVCNRSEAATRILHGDYEATRLSAI